MPPRWQPVEQGIGYHPQTDGNGNIASTTTQENGRMVTHYTWVEDGRLMAPVDQRTGTTVTPPTYAPGQAVPCLVEEAHDWDTYVTPSSQTPEADSVSSYQWSCSRGTFESDGVGPSATWPETGSHDDGPLVRTGTVHYSSGEAKLGNSGTDIAA